MLGLDKHTILINVISDPIPSISIYSASSLPATNGVQCSGKTTDGLRKIWIGLNGSAVITDSVSYPSLILNCICEICQSYVEVTIALHGFLIHLDCSIELTNILQKATQISIEMSMSLVDVESKVVVLQRKVHATSRNHTGYVQHRLCRCG